MATKEKNIWLLVLFILCGIVIGSLIGEVVSQVEALWWIGYGQTFGLTAPLTLDMGVISLTFAMTLKINIASIIGLGIALFLYRKL